MCIWCGMLKEITAVKSLATVDKIGRKKIRTSMNRVIQMDQVDDNQSTRQKL